MAWFSRRKKNTTSASQPVEREETGQNLAAQNSGAAEGSVETTAGAEAPAAGPKERGPYDESEAPENPALIDGGALRLPILPDATMQFSVDRERQVVLGVVYVMGDSAVQLQVFAAPKSASLWEDIRVEVISSIANQGGRFQEAEGEYGPEIQAQMPAENGRVPVRFIGIDGPRWLLRVAVTGRGAVDPERGTEVLHRVLDDLVVVRGTQAIPPRELLPLALPQQGEPEPETPDTGIELPKRGPEIQEIH
ncbi:DUF3710 domain-containing protein [Actinotignum schaalii]|uniref:DUF3710 domain-containing protein n=1 Tax=Actinotignum schaalii FB123-CNA-2 TaxID=883067 RepID=S2WGS6_9ACTO|nr:DUF3710 domain-containing protein [Actinotignum schaalii]EPD27089.1 hypothetical protein HMPREF9237_01026 [Actinotignum schaalii FB123-CNA-2]